MLAECGGKAATRHPAAIPALAKHLREAYMQGNVAKTA